MVNILILMLNFNPMILMYPPVSRVCEPPVALGRMSGYLSVHGVDHICIDGNSECFSYSFNSDASVNDTWTRRASKRKGESLAGLTSPRGYGNYDNYVRYVKNISRVVAKSSVFSSRFSVGITDYTDEELSPVKSADLRKAFIEYSENPFYLWFSNRIQNILNTEKGAGYTWFGLSVSYLSQVLTAFSLAGYFSSRYPELKIVIGGGLMQSWYDSPAFINLCKDLDILCWEGSGESFVDTHILSVPQSVSGKNVLEKKENRFTIPDFSFALSNTYIAPGLILPYSPTIGCSYKGCKFCSETWEGQDFCTPGNEAAYQGYLKLSKKYTPRSIHFCDNEMSPGLLRKLASGNDNNHAPWYGFSRIIPDFSDPGFCNSLNAGGCEMLCLGIESGSQKVLDGMNKGIQIADVGPALVNLTNAGIKTFCYFLFGTPWEDALSAEETVSFIREYSKYISYMNISIFNLPQKSPLVKELEIKRFYEGDLSLYYDFAHPYGWDRRKVRSFLQTKLYRDKEIRKIINRTPPVFTSSHAAFFT